MTCLAYGGLVVREGVNEPRRALPTLTPSDFWHPDRVARRRWHRWARTRDTTTHPNHYCRTHGEMLHAALHLDGWICPEHTICGTFVVDEHLTDGFEQDTITIGPFTLKVIQDPDMPPGRFVIGSPDHPARVFQSSRPGPTWDAFRYVPDEHLALTIPRPHS